MYIYMRVVRDLQEYMIEHNATRVDDGRIYCIILAIKMKAHTVLGRGGGGPAI